MEEKSLFTEDKNAEGLYETTGISNYYVREFKNNIINFKCLNDYAQDEFTNQNEAVGDVRRYRVYRNLVYSLATYTEDLNEFELDYLRRFRSSINNEISKYIKGEIELTKNMAVLFIDDEVKGKFDYPNNKAISDITLLVNNNILEKINDEKLTVNSDETVNVSKEMLYRIIKDVKCENESYFSKNYREMSQDVFIKEIISYLKEYEFLCETSDGYKIYPMVGRITGYIPKEKESQLELFGGLDE